MAKRIFILTQEDEALRTAWTRLAELGINSTDDDPYECHNPKYEESWQYMGSVEDGAQVWHEFRHRAHPALNNSRVLVKIAADAINMNISWTEGTDINKLDPRLFPTK